MRCALHNLGCKVNSYETEAMRQLLVKAGWTIVEFGEEKADVYIINTCTVTNIADRKSRQMLHRAKKENPEAVVVAVGCYAQEAGEKLLADEAVDIIVGNNEKGRIVEKIERYFADRDSGEKGGALFDIGGEKGGTLSDIGGEKEYERLEISESTTRARAFIKIQDGCNQFCTYCIIPYVRGRVRSRRKEDILAEVNRLAKSGCREIVVTGIHLGSYGLDFDKKEYDAGQSSNGERLISVIEDIAKVAGIERIRLSSLEPRIITPEFVKRLAAVDKICPHFHLSLQSGCDATLKRMNRRYDTAEYEKSVNLLRKAFDRPAITTDVIVGFPGETNEEFETSRRFLEKIGFFELHVFKYSRRDGTVAARMENQVPDSEKSRRSDELIALDGRLSGKYRESFVGCRQRVLIEEYVTVDGEKLAAGHTERYVKVFVRMPEEKQNVQIADVIITGILGNDSVMAQIV